MNPPTDPFTSWNFRVTADTPTERYRAEQLYFRRFRTYPVYPPVILKDRTGITMRFALPEQGPPPELVPEPESAPLEAEQLKLL